MSSSISAIALWGSQWLSSIFRTQQRGQPRPDLDHIRVPPEIILMIAAHLDNVSAISLGLTCRTLYRLVFPRHARLNCRERQALLLLLEREAARHYFCHYCVRLHRWHQSWFRLSHHSFFWDILWDKPSCKKESWFQDKGGYGDYILPYHLARVVMNQHFYGAAHGVSARKLNACLSRRPVPGVIRFKMHDTWEARIIDDRLMLSSVLSITHPNGNLDVLKEYIDRRGSGVCFHLCHIVWPGENVSNPPVDCLIPKRFKSHCHYIKSCPLCTTDYCMNVGWHEAKKGWIIKITSYRDLGAVRAPFDWDWHQMTRLGRNGVSSRTKSEGSGPGTIRQRWNQANNVELEPEGEWYV